MYARISSVDFSGLMANLVDNFLNEDLKTCLIVYFIIGLLLGLLIRLKGANIIFNVFCSVVGACVGGYLYIRTIGSFYGIIGSMAASVAGAVVFLLIKRGFVSGDQG